MVKLKYLTAMYLNFKMKKNSNLEVNQHGKKENY